MEAQLTPAVVLFFPRRPMHMQKMTRLTPPASCAEPTHTARPLRSRPWRAGSAGGDSVELGSSSQPRGESLSQALLFRLCCHQVNKQ